MRALIAENADIYGILLYAQIAWCLYNAASNKLIVIFMYPNKTKTTTKASHLFHKRNTHIAPLPLVNKQKKNTFASFMYSFVFKKMLYIYS